MPIPAGPNLPLFIKTQADIQDPDTINKHFPYNRVADKTQRERKALCEEIRHYWPRTQGQDWLPRKHWPKDMPEDPLDWSPSILKGLRNLAKITVGDIKLAQRHLQDIARENRLDENGKLCEKDIFDAYNARQQEIGAEGERSRHQSFQSDQGAAGKGPDPPGSPFDQPPPNFNNQQQSSFNNAQQSNAHHPEHPIFGNQQPSIFNDHRRQSTFPFFRQPSVSEESADEEIVRPNLSIQPYDAPSNLFKAQTPSFPDQRHGSWAKVRVALFESTLPMPGAGPLQFPSMNDSDPFNTQQQPTWVQDTQHHQAMPLVFYQGASTGSGPSGSNGPTGSTDAAGSHGSTGATGSNGSTPSSSSGVGGSWQNHAQGNPLGNSIDEAFKRHAQRQPMCSTISNGVGPQGFQQQSYQMIFSMPTWAPHFGQQPSPQPPSGQPHFDQSSSGQSPFAQPPSGQSRSEQPPPGQPPSRPSPFAQSPSGQSHSEQPQFGQPGSGKPSSKGKSPARERE